MMQQGLMLRTANTATEALYFLNTTLLRDTLKRRTKKTHTDIVTVGDMNR
jgi:hypothetical protein